MNGTYQGTKGQVRLFLVFIIATVSVCFTTTSAKAESPYGQVLSVSGNGQYMLTETQAEAWFFSGIYIAKSATIFDINTDMQIDFRVNSLWFNSGVFALDWEDSDFKDVDQYLRVFDSTSNSWTLLGESHGRTYWKQDPYDPGNSKWAKTPCSFSSQSTEVPTSPEITLRYEFHGYDPYPGMYVSGQRFGFKAVDVQHWSLSPTWPTGSPPSQNCFNGNQSDRSGDSADPVNTATGNFIHEEKDLTIPTRTAPLEFKRFYNSKDTRTSSLGQGWTHSYYILLAKDTNETNVNVRWGDGRTDYWRYDANTTSYRPAQAGLYDRLIKNVDNSWTVIKKNLDMYNFDSMGKLSTVVDKNGNTTTLAYNYSDPNFVTSITDPANRTVTLQYQNSRLSAISDFASRSVEYYYTNERLMQVTDVNGLPISYTYDINGYLKTITNQRGIVDVNNIYDSQGRVVQQRDGRNYISTFAYDTPSFDKTTITDPNGETTVHTHFSGYKLLQSVKDALGNTVYYTYDANANRTSIADRNIHKKEFYYDSRGNVTSTLDPNDPNNPDDGGITQVQYDDANFPDFPTKKIDALGNITDWKYDSHGNVKEQIDPNGNHKYWTYNSFGQKLTETDENGNTTTFTYDTVGKLIQKIDPNENNTWFGYDSLWRLTDVTDGRGSSAGDLSYTVHNMYDNADRIISITEPNTNESYQYDNVGHKTQITNGRGYKTKYYYDENGNLTKVEKDAPNSQKQTIQYTYDNLNRKLTFSDPNTNLTTYTYDAVGHLLTETNAESNQTTYTYDAQGNMLSVTDGNGVKISYKYDWLNRKVEQYDLIGNHWYWQYDKLGRVIKSTDARAAKTIYGYDVLGRLISVTDDCNQTTRYQYDKVGNLTQIIDAGGIISTKKFYDTANRLKRQEDGNGNIHQYGYDGAGNRISVIDAKNQTTTYIYDSHNSLIKINYPDSTQATYAYDRNSNLTSTTGLAGTTTYVYDELDRLIISTDCFSKQVIYGYDLIGNRTSITYPADSSNPSRTVIYEYDTANRLKKVTDWLSHSWTYAVDGAGRMTQLTNPNGLKENRTYDNAGRLSGLAYKKSDNTTLISYSYNRDGQGNPTNITETGTISPNPQLPIKTSYNYDTDNRLTDTDQPTSYDYDNNGNLVTRTINGITTNFSYDFENRLIYQSKNGSTVQHIYDSIGNRIARVQDGITTRYILDYGRDMSHVLCETDGSGNITAYYIQGNILAGQIGTDGSAKYYHCDHIGNIVALTDSNQMITDKYAYTPFGVSAGKQGSTVNPFTYVGSFGVMTDAGLYFMRARFYDTETGRFLSKDPVEGSLIEPLELHRYVYGNNNPVMYIDANGKVAWFVPIAVGAIVGGVWNTGEYIIENHDDLNLLDGAKAFAGGSASGAIGVGSVMLGTGTFAGGFVGSLAETSIETWELPNAEDYKKAVVSGSLSVVSGAITESVLPKATGRNAQKLTTVLSGKQTLQEVYRSVTKITIKKMIENVPYFYETDIQRITLADRCPR